MSDNLKRLNQFYLDAGKTTLADYTGGRALAACALLICEKLDTLIKIATGDEDAVSDGHVRGSVAPKEPNA